MRVYPKGCRHVVVQNGQVTRMMKTRKRATIEQLTMYARNQDTRYIVVQPRGKMKWWLFEKPWGVDAKFVATAYEPDSLIMRALLS